MYVTLEMGIMTVYAITADMIFVGIVLSRISSWESKTAGREGTGQE